MTIELARGGNGSFNRKPVRVVKVTKTEVHIAEEPDRVRRFMRRTGYERGVQNGFGHRPWFIPADQLALVTP